MGAVAVVILSVVLGVVLVKGTPDLGKIRDDLERNSIASVSFKSETTTKTPETTTSTLTNPTETSTLPVQVSTSTYLPQTVPSSSAVTIGNKVYLTSVSVGAISDTYVGSAITYRESTDLGTNGATVNVPSGYYSEDASKTVTTTEHPNPSVSVNSETGLITATHTQSTGYVYEYLETELATGKMV